MKIRIIGCSGSGKSYLAKKLALKYGVPSFDLDEIQWANEEGYGKKRDPAEKEKMLAEKLELQNWILEGVYYAWCGQTFVAADCIVLLEVPTWLCRLRILRRFIRRKLTGWPRKETFSSLFGLLKWVKHFQKVNLPEIKTLLEPYRSKVLILKNKRQIRAYLEKK